MKQYGEYLKELREARKLSIEQVSEDTKIVAEVIEALESMNKEKIASEVHLVGFIKLYTKYLGGDEKHALELFKSTAVSEIPIQFDVINISKKKKNAKHTYLPAVCIILILIVACAIGLRWGYPKIRSLIAQRELSKLQRNSKVTKIENVYENTFLLKETILLVKGDAKATAVITSISPPVISIDKKKYKLKENIPTSIFLAKDVAYIVILRDSNITKRSLLLRFDPRSANPRIPQAQESEIGTTTENAIEDAINNADGEVFQILSSTVATPIQVRIAAKIPGAAYYQYETSEESRQGIVSDPIFKTIAQQEYIDVYLSNAAIIELNVNEVLVPLSEKNLPMVFRVIWKEISIDEYRLLLIPLP